MKYKTTLRNNETNELEIKIIDADSDLELNWSLLLDYPNYSVESIEEVEYESCDMCGDNRFQIIEEAKSHLLEATNIKTSPDEMAVLDNFLFRCWQMGWLDKYDTSK